MSRRVAGGVMMVMDAMAMRHAARDGQGLEKRDHGRRRRPLCNVYLIGTARPSTGQFP